MFTFSVPTTALFGAGKLDELHTQINTPMGAVHGQKALVVISSGKSARAAIWIVWRMSCGRPAQRMW